MRLSRCGLVIFVLLVSVVRGGVEPPPATYQIAVLPLHHRTICGSSGRRYAVSATDPSVCLLFPPPRPPANKKGPMSL
jgi:hypothetical protein